MEIKKTTKRNGLNYALVTNIPKNISLNLLAKKYSKKYKLSAFPSSHLKNNKLLLIKRNISLKKILSWSEWERK